MAGEAGADPAAPVTEHTAVDGTATGARRRRVRDLIGYQGKRSRAMSFTL